MKGVCTSGLVGCSFFAFFKVFFAILFSFASCAQLGIAVLLCKAITKVHEEIENP